MSIRSQFAEQIRDDWSSIPTLAGLRVVSGTRALDDLRQSTAVVHVGVMTPSAVAPGARSHQIVVTIISKHRDLDRAESELEELTDAALAYFRPRVQLGAAQPVDWNDSHLAIEVSVIVTTAS